MSKRFQHLGTEWEAVSSGVTTGAGFLGDNPPPLTTHGVIFRAPWGEIRGAIAHADPDEASDDELRRALTIELERRVLPSINQSQYVWRPAEAIATEAGLPVEMVRQFLESSPEVMRAPGPNKQGYLLYTTRDHYRKLTPWLKRYGNIVKESS